MKHCCLILLLLILIAAPVVATVITPGQIIFKTSLPMEVKSDRTGLTAFDSYLNQLDAHNLRPIKAMHSPQYFLATVTNEPDWDALINGKLSFPGIEYVQPNYLRKLHVTPNDPLYHLQFHDDVSSPQAWNYATGSKMVVVGVVDSGCLIEHPDLAANIWVNPGEIPGDGIDNDQNGYIDDVHGWDFTDAPEFADVAIGDYLEPDNDVTDENFHGTHVAGIIGAVGNNGIGIAGVAWNVSLMPIRAGFRTTGGQGTLQDDDAASAIVYAADNGCHVINMSWGDPAYSPIIGDACAYAYDKGVTLVASAGNDPGPYLSYPAKLSTVIAVGSVNRSLNLSGFSSYGADMELVAPGDLILSTYRLEPDQLYYEQSGTSMSSPFVAGAAALLLSLHPDLSPAEVRARMLSATDDLGPAGVDTQYGHGLLNIQKLLENANPPLVYIDNPAEHFGLTGSTRIDGTVCGSDLFRYSVMYSGAKNPTQLDWYDVTEHTNYPVYHTNPVINDSLAYFYIPEGFPEGDYKLRIEYHKRGGGKYPYFRNLTYDTTIPQLKEGSLQSFKRYDRQNLRYYISAVFDEPVISELLVHASDSSLHRCYSTKLDTLHVWSLPPTIPEGPIGIEYKATNNSNLSLHSGLINNFTNIAYESIPVHGFEWEEVGNPRVPLNYTFDYNSDGLPEYLAMEIPASGYGNVSAYQPQPGGHVVSHSFNDSFWLLGAGDTNNTGQEILMLRGDTAVILESHGLSQYPNLPLWEEASVTGGTIADYSGDGIQDLLLVKDLPTQRIIQAYKRSGNTFLAKNKLLNTSPTNMRNTFVPTITVNNFDNDNYLDILTADTDGDVMMFEIRNDNLHELTWSTRLPVANTYSITSGDFDGNGVQDFMVGGYYRDVLDPNRNFWYFEGFRSNGNNYYSSMGHLMFNEVISQNAIQAMDVDDDGKDEIILAIAPNLYIIKYIDYKFKPIFHDNSYQTYRILATRDSNGSPWFLTNYEVAPDTIRAVQWKRQEPFTGPPSPVNFLATPMDHATVHLTWLTCNADYFRLYRQDPDGQVVMLADNVVSDSYMDVDLSEGQTYKYRVTAVNNAYSPPESVPTPWISATPNPVPQLVMERSGMVSANEIRVFFDCPMASSNLNPTLFFLSHGMDNPSSVNGVDGNTGLHLRFNKPLPVIGEDFTLQMHNLKSAAGIKINSLSCQFPYFEDTEQPRVLSATVQPNGTSVLIKFSESLLPENPNPERLDNYHLTCPTTDADNTLLSVSHRDDELLVTLAGPIKFSTSAYYLRISNLRDLAGNVISPQYNVARFNLINTKNLESVVVFPNPVLAKENPYCYFANFPPHKKGRIKIFSTSGNLVYSGDIGPFDPLQGNSKWMWNLKNRDGVNVSSGVYFYLIEMDGDIARGKLAIIR